MSELNNLFETIETINAGSNRSLSGTAQLTSIASEIAANIIREMNDDIDNYRDSLKASQTDNNSMDALINRFTYIETANIDFLQELSSATLDSMLKSQQSKRSRCKSKAMTLDNYKSLMTASIAEILIRKALGKDKGSVGARRASGSVDYTIEELEQLSIDQEALRKEIRNVQSKKSIMKSKAGFSEYDERWIALCKAEQQLKDMRVSTSGTVQTVEVEVDTTKDAVNELLANVDIQHLNAKDSKALLDKIAQLTAGIATDDAE